MHQIFADAEFTIGLEVSNVSVTPQNQK